MPASHSIVRTAPEPSLKNETNNQRGKTGILIKKFQLKHKKHKDFIDH